MRLGRRFLITLAFTANTKTRGALSSVAWATFPNRSHHTMRLGVDEVVESNVHDGALVSRARREEVVLVRRAAVRRGGWENVF